MRNKIYYLGAAEWANDLKYFAHELLVQTYILVYKNPVVSSSKTPQWRPFNFPSLNYFEGSTQLMIIFPMLHQYDHW
jgi:hypothetical protein